MALAFKKLLQSQIEYSEAAAQPKVSESISSADLKTIMSKAVEMGGDINENVIKLYDEMRKQTAIVQQSTKDDTAVAEERQEAAKIDEDQTDLLEKIADNTDPNNKKKPEELGLGKIVAGVVMALAGLAGAVAGYVKSIKVLLDAFTPEFIKRKLTKTVTAITETFAEFASKIKKVFSGGADRIASFFSEGLGKLKNLLSFEEGSKVARLIQSVKDTFTKVLVPFREAFVAIRELMTGTAKGLEWVGNVSKGIMKTLGSIGTYIDDIVRLFKGVFRIVKTIAAPLFIIMTLWDTVKGAIEGFDKAGLIGGVLGAIKGLVSSLVTVPLDLIKDIVSWTLDALGLDFLSEMLDSFSFDELWTGLMDGIMDVANALMHPIDTMMKLFDSIGGAIDEYIMQPLKDAFEPITSFFSSIKDSIVGFFEAIEIPKIGFTIPIIDKEVSIGPFYPFRREKPSEAEVEAGKTAAAEASPPQKGSREEYDVAYKKNLEKTGGNERVAQKLTAMEVGLAPGAHPDTLQSNTSAVQGGTAIPQATATETKQAEVNAIMNGEPAPSSRQEYYKQQGFTPEQISTLNERQSRIDALRSQDHNAAIDKELAISSVATPEKVKNETPVGVSQIGAERILSAPQQLTGASTTNTSAAANLVYGASADNAAASAAPVSKGDTNNTVVAPTNVTNNTVNSFKQDVRNQDSSFKRMLDVRYVPV